MKKVVILGSFKPRSWPKVVEAIEKFEKDGYEVLSPIDKEMFTTVSADNQDFYYLKADLKKSGYEEKDLEGKNLEYLTKIIDLRKIQADVCKKIKEADEIYVVVFDGKLGKSTACELALAINLNKKISFNNKVCRVSVEVPLKVRDQIVNFLSNKNSCIEEKTDYLAKKVLLRKCFAAYERPANEWVEIF